MNKMNKLDSQKAMPAGSQGFVQILLVVGIVAALAVIGFVLYRQRMAVSNQTALTAPSAATGAQYSQGSAGAPQIQNASDLNKASASLDSTDTTQIDTQLNALNSASSGF